MTPHVIKACGTSGSIIQRLLQPVDGELHFGILQAHLLDILKYDTAVRDVHTTGHLGKFLSRLDVFAEMSDIRIIAMHNPIFDALSQSERVEFFKAGASLEMDADLFDLPTVQAMLARERRILAES